MLNYSYTTFTSKTVPSNTLEIWGYIYNVPLETIWIFKYIGDIGTYLLENNYYNQQSYMF